MTEFSELLKKYRLRSRRPKDSKSLTQRRLVELIDTSDPPRLDVPTISRWETGTRVLKERKILVRIIRVLVEYRGIKTLDEANQLSQAGNFGLLTNEELAQINSAWVSINPPLNDSKYTATTFHQQSQHFRTLLPPPFEWITIPQGIVDVQQTSKEETRSNWLMVPEFQISKYPITNSQFQFFVDHSQGYNDSRWWDDSSVIKSGQQNNLSPAFAGSNLPRTNVSWFECIAFCRWLSHRSGEIINLPQERQWQRAAQGDTNNAYPWGRKWIKGACNYWTPPHSDMLTPVNAHPNGASMHGVFDMSGNAWEWCLDKFEVSGDARVLKGGSYRENKIKYFRAAFRRGFDPFQRGPTAGFRIIKAPSTHDA